MAYARKRSFNSTKTCALPGCYKPCWESGGIVHDFCGRTHAAEAVERGIIPSLAPPHGHCHERKLPGCRETVFFEHDTGRVHDYCCRTHAYQAGVLSGGGGSGGYAAQGPQRGRSARCRAARARCTSTPLRAARTTTAAARTHASTRRCRAAAAAAAPRDCSFPGCSQPRRLDPYTGQPMHFCSHNHRQRAEERGLGAILEAGVERVFTMSRPNATGHTDTGFQLSLLTRTHTDFAPVREQFLSKWTKPGTPPSVIRVFKVKVPDHVFRAYDAYKQFKGNRVRRRFHGTSCGIDCNFFVNLRDGPCGGHDCAVCGICTHGFLMEYSGATAERTNFNLRYGRGLYFSSISGKSHDYAELSEHVSPSNGQAACWRVMFVCSVVVGKAFETEEPTLAGPLPPNGHDSIVANPSAGKLNYDELVVYCNEAAIPTFMIAYTLPY
eukprot:TRINITY_DN409_c1_g1_i2.p1 TRINITY_DN409_c1_g1~~TRINITY_DN409_c1_g1_i2.p1  ORF type:complete len:439 (-),score=135.60 TRINITY_DN409_c1_g1_i2:1682-2998(-)